MIDAANPDAHAALAPLNLVAACQAADPSCPLPPGGEPNRVAIFGAAMAVAVAAPAPNRTENGYVVFFNLRHC